MKFTSVLALVAVAQAIKIKSKDAHPCELLESNGEDMDTSLAVQLDSQISEPQIEQFKALAEKLDIELTPELLSLGSNEEISNALIEIALGMGKTETDISTAMGGV